NGIIFAHNLFIVSLRVVKSGVDAQCMLFPGVQIERPDCGGGPATGWGFMPNGTDAEHTAHARIGHE
ncbi:hypothetical protein, partial [Burkholderia gladioli]|uniref:hypothetical protein n=1 Tax=Burkholderia gladioli TaxID=28095 RepID=UPI001ABA212A